MAFSVYLTDGTFKNFDNYVGAMEYAESVYDWRPLPIYKDGFVITTYYGQELEKTPKTFPIKLKDADLLLWSIPSSFFIATICAVGLPNTLGTYPIFFKAILKLLIDVLSLLV
jgi:hypothetical protein